MFKYYFLAGITGLFLYAFDNEMLDLADFECRKYKDQEIRRLDYANLEIRKD